MSEHRSISQINKFTICPRKYRFRYIDGLPSSGSLATAIGSAFDNAINYVIDHFDHEAYADHPTEAAKVKLDEVIRQAVENLLDSGADKLTEIPHTEEDYETFCSTVFHLSKLISPYFKEYLPKQGLIPVKAQHKISYDFDELGKPVTGFIDMIAKSMYTGKIVIVDQKSGKGSKREASLEHKRQVWLYSKAIEEEFNLDYLPQAEVHYFNKTLPKLPREKKKDNHVNGVAFSPSDLKETPFHLYPTELVKALYTEEELISKVDLVPARFDQSEWDSLEESFFDLEFSHQNNFWPKNRTHTLCSPQYCEYWDRCVGATETTESLCSMRSRVSLRSKASQMAPEKFVADVKVPPSVREPEVKPPPTPAGSPSVVDFLIN